MHEHEVIQLIQAKAPSELSPDEVVALQKAVEASPELFAKLITEYDKATYLDQLMTLSSAVDSSPQPRRGRSTWLPLLGIALAPLLLLAVVIVAVQAPPRDLSTARSENGEHAPAQAAAPVDAAATATDQPQSSVASPATDDVESSASDSDAKVTDPPAPDPAAPRETPAETPESVPAEPKTAVPRAADSTPAASPEADGETLITLNAADYADGNLVIETVRHDGGKVTTVTAKSSKSFALYKFSAPKAGWYELRTHYAIDGTARVAVSVNGQKSRRTRGLKSTQGSSVADLQWFSTDYFELQEGENTLHVAARGGRFPRIHQFVFHSTPEHVDHDSDDAEIPWLAVLDDERPPPAWDRIGFDTFDIKRSVPRVDELKHWFHPVESGLKNSKSGNIECGAFSGLMKLKAPLFEDTALRFWVVAPERQTLQTLVHCFYGDEGVSFALFAAEQHRWAAYATTRKPEQPRPDQYTITGGDRAIAYRTSNWVNGTVEIRYAHDAMILSRGDVILARAPLPGPPDEIYFEGRMAFYGIDLVRSTSPPPPPPSRPLVVDIQDCAALEWTESFGDVEHTTFTKNDDGSVTLAARQAGAVGRVVTPLPSRGLHELILEVDDATFGAGVFFGRGENGDAHELVRFGRNKRDGSLCITPAYNDANYEHDFGVLRERFVPLVQPHLWVKLIYGCGVIRWFTSVDGIHWGEAGAPFGRRHPDVTSIGLHVINGRPDCQLTLKRIQIRELSQLTGLVEADNLERAVAPEQPTYGQWLTEVLGQQPRDCETRQWLRACALKTLGVGYRYELTQPILDMLLDDIIELPLPIDKKFDILDESLLLADYMDSTEQALQAFNRYFAVAEHAGVEHPYAQARRRRMTAPVWCRHHFDITDASRVNAELLRLLHERRWADVLSLCEQIRYFNDQAKVPLLAWANWTAQSELGLEQGSGEDARGDWQPAMVEQLSKETYNALAELNALLDSDALDDAARRVTSLQPTITAGVSTVDDDPDLLANLATAIRLQLRRHPQLADLIASQYAALAGLRIREAMVRGDAAAVEFFAVQFGPTEAARDAQIWLGDRALSNGWFHSAFARYQEAARGASLETSAKLVHRIRLAAAMLGRDAGAPAVGPVTIGDKTMPAAEFEALVAEMRQQVTAGSGTGSPPLNDAVFVPKTVEVAHRGRVDGLVGERPNEEITPYLNHFKVDWTGRQLATVIDGNRLYVSNRFHVACYEMPGARRLWRTPRIPGKMLRSRDWSSIPMTPLIQGDFLFVRLLYEDGPLLCCFRRDNGSLVWVAEQTEREQVISDPVIMHGRLVALALSPELQSQRFVRLVTFHQQTGETISRRDVIGVRDSWQQHRTCLTATCEDGIVAAVGDAILKVSLDGSLQWIRKQSILPAREYIDWVRQRYQPPLIDDDHVVCSQPGSLVVQNLTTDTGELVWQYHDSDLLGVLGRFANRVLVETARGYLALDNDTGKVAWEHVDAQRLDGHLLSDNVIVYVAFRPLPNRADVFRPHLVWLDAADGRLMMAVPLEGIDDPNPRLGPLVAYDDRVLGFFSRGQNDPNRDMFEFAFKDTPVLPADFIEIDDDTWFDEFDRNIRRDVFRVLPKWHLLSGLTHQRGFVADIHGEKNVVSIETDGGRPCIFAREITIPANEKPKLRIRLGRDAGRKSIVEVRFRGQVLKSLEISDQSHPDRFVTLAADLSRFAGQTGWLTISVQHREGSNTIVYWKQLDVVY